MDKRCSLQTLDKIFVKMRSTQQKLLCSVAGIKALLLLSHDYVLARTTSTGQISQWAHQQNEEILEYFIYISVKIREENQ